MASLISSRKEEGAVGCLARRKGKNKTDWKCERSFCLMSFCLSLPCVDCFASVCLLLCYFVAFICYFVHTYGECGAGALSAQLLGNKPGAPSVRMNARLILAFLCTVPSPGLVHGFFLGGAL